MSQVFSTREFNYTNLCRGQQLVLWGLIEIVVIALRADAYVGGVISAGGVGILYMLGLFVVFAIELVAGFDGIMNICIGLAQSIGYVTTRERIAERLSNQSKKGSGDAAYPDNASQFSKHEISNNSENCNRIEICADRNISKNKKVGIAILVIIAVYIILLVLRVGSLSDMLRLCNSALAAGIGTNGISELMHQLVDFGMKGADYELFALMCLLLLVVFVTHKRGKSIRDFIDRQNIVVRWLIYLAAIALLVICGYYGTTIPISEV